MSLSTPDPALHIEEQRECAAVALRSLEHVLRFRQHDDSGLSHLWEHMAKLEAGKEEGAAELATVALYCLNRLGQTANRADLQPAIEHLNDIALSDPKPGLSPKEMEAALSQVKTAADSLLGRWLCLYAREIAAGVDVRQSRTPLLDRVTVRRELAHYSLRTVNDPDTPLNPPGAITYAAEEPNTPLP